MVEREFVCDVLQRYFAKKMMKRYRFPRELELDIAKEMNTSVEMVHMVITLNVA